MTKKVSTVMNYEKEYLVNIQFGKRTDTLDSTGKVTVIKKYKPLDLKGINKILNCFKGEIDQVPPMYSALKYKGKRLYSLARKGIVVNRKPRKILIHNIKLISHDDFSIKIKVLCEKGTYIRSLARDIGHKLNTEAYVENLIRTRVGHFDKKTSISAEDFKVWLLSQQHIQN
jgi:tRNA pseudouridine55 synthase